MPEEFVLGPAYGRDYQTVQEALADWNKNLDFTVYYPFGSGTYINRSDYTTYGNRAPIWVRFNGLTEKERLV